MISSYLFYTTTVLLPTMFAGLAQKKSILTKKGRREPNKIFWFISMGILMFVMGFRANSVGVDDLNYLGGYNYANSVSFFQYYQTRVTEPGFYLLYRIVYFLFNDFQWLIILTSVITVFCFYKALAYENENISLALAVFIFSTTQYFYYFGIIRLGLAVSIVVVAYHYILENKKKKYIMMVLLATMFHYSALFALVLLFIKYDRNKKFKKSTIVKLVLIIPAVFYCIKLFVYTFITASKYQSYIESSGIISFSFISAMPFFILFLLQYNKFTAINRNYQFYFFLFLIKVVTEMFAPIIGIGRMVWYVNLSLCFLLPATIRINKDRMIRLTILVLTILYCVVYSYYAYFGESYRGLFMLPYRNVYFDLGY